MQYPIIVAFTVSTMMSYITCAPASSYGDRAIDTITGQTLVDVGSEFNITVLTVIGRAMKNMESDVKEAVNELCRLHPCTHWSQWSNCDVSADKYGKIGAKKRTRNCGGNTTLCNRYGISRLVYEYEVCQNLCPTDYTVTKYGFCLKYYAGPKTWDEAEDVCRNDGGHLVNVDSEIKVHDVNMTLSAHTLSGSNANMVWIDGRKSVQGASWTYGYKSTDPAFDFWSDNDPDNGPNELCIMYHRKPSADANMWRWYDYICSNKYHFVCQIAY